MTVPGSAPDRPSYEDVADLLATAHRRADPGIINIYLARDPQAREIRLIEVTTEAPTTMEALPFRFAATRDVPFPSAVLLLSPEEWEARLRRALEMPEGWESVEELVGRGA